MYYQYLGLNEAPFSIAVNPRYLYMSPRHRDALAHLLYGVGAGGGFILLTGEVGTGKTTINRCLIEQLPENADIAIVLNPALDSRDMLATVCEELGIEFDENRPGLKELTDSLHRFLLSNHGKQRKTVLMIDEAQHLSFDVLEQIRLLTNLETSDEKLLHIILIGQPELAAKLARPELRQLNQRITARFDLQPLSLPETSAYIRHRLHIAGMPAGRELFSPSLVRAIHKESRGVPRLINLLCDRMLLGAYGRDSDRLDKALLGQAVREVLGSQETRYALKAPRWSWVLAFFFVLAMVFSASIAWLVLAKQRPQTDIVTAELSQELPQELSQELSQELLEQQPGTAELSPTGAAAPFDNELGAGKAGEMNDWRLSPQDGAISLGALYGARRPLLANPCATNFGTSPAIASDLDSTRSSTTDAALGSSLDSAEGLRCEARRLQSWNQLIAEGRPALLGLLDARRFEGRALLLAIVGSHAILKSPDGVRHVPLEDLAREWTGEVWQLWQPSAGVTRTLERGDVGEDVGTVAALFARLDGQSQALTDSLFDERLERRVRLFQRQRGLRADGVLGENTLRALSLAVGDDLGFEGARAWASSTSSDTGVQRP